MRRTILKRLQELEAMVESVDRKQVMLLDVDDFDPADRDAFLDGDDSVLTRYGFEPDDPSPGIRAIIISAHPERRDDWEAISDLDDEELERRELDERRRQSEDVERRELEAIQATREELPSAPGNAYSPV